MQTGEEGPVDPIFVLLKHNRLTMSCFTPANALIGAQCGLDASPSLPPAQAAGGISPMNGRSHALFIFHRRVSADRSSQEPKVDT